MRYWIRQATLTIGNKQYSLDNLNFKFKVLFEDRAKVSTAEIEVYNLLPATQDGIKKGDLIIISAGYRDDAGTIFIGEISDFSHNRANIDTTSKIAAADSMDAWVNAGVNKTYKAGMYASEILPDLLSIFGVPVGMIKLAVDKYYPGCRICRGRLKDVLTDIVTNDCKSRLLIRTGQIMINPPEEGIVKGYLLTPQTGLLKDTKSGDSRNKDGSTITRSCLLNPHIGAADIVQVKDSLVDGNYRVVSGIHEGSRDGDWKTTLELVPL